jgi:hypothetical protein
MKQKIVPLMVIMAALAGCRSANDGVSAPADELYRCVGPECSIIRMDTPNGNDLTLETKKHVIEIQADPKTQYSYYVWTNGKPTTAEPDLIVEDGKAMMLVEEE